MLNIQLQAKSNQLDLNSLSVRELKTRLAALNIDVSDLEKFDLVTKLAKAVCWRHVLCWCGLVISLLIIIQLNKEHHSLATVSVHVLECIYKRLYNRDICAVACTCRKLGEETSAYPVIYQCVRYL